MDLGLGSLFGGIIGGAAGVWQSYNNWKAQQETNATNLKIAQENLAFQREANEQNLALTREQWARDDNAISRRVADLTANGLSKTLAAGSGAGNSSPIPVKPLENTYNHQNNPIDVLTAVQMSQDFATKALQNDLLYQQVKQQKWLTNYLNTNDTYPATTPAPLSSRDKWNLGFQSVDTLRDIAGDAVKVYLFKKALDKFKPNKPGPQGPGRFKMIAEDERTREWHNTAKKMSVDELYKELEESRKFTWSKFGRAVMDVINGNDTTLDKFKSFSRGSKKALQIYSMFSPFYGVSPMYSY